MRHGPCQTTCRAIVAAGAILLSASCVFDSDLSPESDPQIVCVTGANDCPEGFVCADAEGGGRCVSTTTPACGNGRLEEGEQCDDENLLRGDGCGPTCRDEECGNGVTDPGEACDDGNVASGDGCRADCARIERCGDGLLDDGEACDDGNDVDEDACLRTCTDNVCGDGILNPEAESCDDGNADNEDGCLTTCGPNVCGDGIRDRESEACDDGNDVDDDACLSSCVVNVCGDGVVNPAAEECDDGNADDADGCLASCLDNVCGDGIVNPLQEQCDGDAPACLPGCIENVCGDAIVNPANEECDDGNDAPGDGCLPGCRANTCGDGVQNPLAEECDDGNEVDTDGCRDDCTRAICGDAVINAGVEACDDGNTDSFDGCRADCRKVEACGDAIVDGDVAQGLGEACDDGNLNPADACDQCRLVTWSIPSLQNADVNALGPGSGVPRAIGFPTAVQRVASAPDGSLVFAAGFKIYRLTPSGALTVLAGNGTEYPGSVQGVGGPATAAALNTPRAVAVDSFGRVFFSDGFDPSEVFRIDESGILERVAGGGTDPGPTVQALTAYLIDVTDVALDTAGRLLMAEHSAHRVRRLEPDGTLSTIAGTGTPGFSGNGGQATAAQFSYPLALAVARDGRIFIADQNNCRVRVIEASGVILTFAGSGCGPGASDDTLAINAAISAPRDVDVRSSGEVLIANYGRIWRVDAGGILRAVAGAPGDLGSDPDAEGPAVTLPLHGVNGIAAAQDGSVYFSTDYNMRLRRIDPQGTLTTVAGTSTFMTGLPATSISLGYVEAAIEDATGRILFADPYACRIFAVELDGTLSPFAGTGVCGAEGDGGPAIAAQVSNVFGMVADGSGGVFLADTGNHVIRHIDSAGTISTFAGNGTPGYTGDWNLAREASFNAPEKLALELDGGLLIADTANHVVRRVDPSGLVMPIAGNGTAGYTGDDDVATSAQLDQPRGLALDANGDLYIADTNNYVLRRVDVDGIITTVPGLEETLPLDVEVADGILYIADNYSRVMALSDGNLSLIAGGGFSVPRHYGDGGWATDASMYGPTNLSFDSAGNMLIADPGNSRVLRIEPDGLIYTVAGRLEPTHGAVASAELSNASQLVMHGSALLAVSRSGRVARVDWTDRKLRFVVGYTPGFPLDSDPVVGSPGRARYVDLLDDPSGLATDGASTLWVSERGSGEILRVTSDDLLDETTTLIASWLGGFVRPAGLWFDGAQLVVADEGAHAIYRVHPTTQAVTLVYGVEGLAGSFTGMLNGPTAVVTDAEGALFIADTGNHRVLKLDASGTAEVVVGTGEAASSGDGAPARSLPVQAPAGLAIDSDGNLIVTSTRSVRLVTADAAGRVDGSGSVYTIYGLPDQRGAWPMDTTACLTGVTERAPGVIDFVDACVGYLITVRRQTGP